MAFPWPSLDTFLFERDERPLDGTDSGWNIRPSYSRSRALGANLDNVVTLAIGSAERSFEAYLAPARFSALSALVNTPATFTDWQQPDPDSRAAFILNVTELGRTRVLCSDGVTRERVHARVELLSQ